uniref:Putative secreted protein n=1 Tax=Ixodes ricinus TaxID=34613 RepID=A0A6B0U0A1_IXORI
MRVCKLCSLLSVFRGYAAVQIWHMQRKGKSNVTCLTFSAYSKMADERVFIVHSLACAMLLHYQLTCD